MRNSLYSVTLDEALDTVGGHGRYQKQLLLVVSGIWLSQSLFMMNLPFLQSHPDSECKEDNCCSQYSSEKTINPSSPGYEWVLICSSSHNSAMISLVYFIGLGLGTFLVSFIANRFGRKNLTIFCMILGSITQFIKALSFSVEGFMALSLLSGVFIGGAVVTSFVYIQELVDGNVRYLYTGVIFAASGLGTTLMTFLHLIVTDWRTVSAVIACSNILWVPLLCKFHESPRFLAANRGKYAEARVVLNHIGKCNGMKEFTEMLEGEKVIGYHESGSLTSPSSPSHSAKYSFVPITSGIVSVSETRTDDVKKYGVLDLIKLKSIRPVFIVSALLWFNVSLGYYVVVFSIPHSVTNPFWTEALVAFVETLSCLTVAFLMNKLGRQLSFVVHFAVAGTCCILSLAFIAKRYPSDTMMRINKTFRVILVSVARFALVSARLTCYMFTVEFFPTNIRSVAFGVLELVTLLGAIFCPCILLLGEVIGIHGLFFVSLFLIIASFFSCLLPETLGKNMEDYVEEEKETMHSPKNKNEGVEMPSRRFQQFNEDSST